MSVPTISETTIVRGREHGVGERQLEIERANSASSPFASPSPRNRPTTDARKPITKASRSTERSTCRREAPSVRSVANSRVRCATVIERVLKITKEPTNSAIPAKASRK